MVKHVKAIAEIERSDMLVYKAIGETRGALTVFTDISCPYCQKFHTEMDTFTDQGIEVRYLLYPRAGADSEAYNDLQSVWCSDNPQQAMTQAKAGAALTRQTCKNPIDQHIAVGDQVGLKGTPLMYLSTGEMVEGINLQLCY